MRAKEEVIKLAHVREAHEMDTVALDNAVSLDFNAKIMGAIKG